jgi:hypothetical protein
MQTNYIDKYIYDAERKRRYNRAVILIKEFNMNFEEHVETYAMRNGIKIINEDEYCRCHIWKKVEFTLDLWQCKNCEKLAVSDKEPMNRNQVYLICHQLVLDYAREKKDDSSTNNSL